MSETPDVIETTERFLACHQCLLWVPVTFGYQPTQSATACALAKPAS